MKSNFIYLDEKNYNNLNITNYDKSSISNVMEMITSILNINVTSKGESYQFSILASDIQQVTYLEELCSTALKNISKAKVEKDAAITKYYVDLRNNRKWYQFWLNNSDKQIAAHVKNKSFMNSDDFIYASGVYFYYVENELKRIRNICNTTIDYSNEKIITVYMSKWKFGQFLHFLTDESGLPDLRYKD